DSRIALSESTIVTARRGPDSRDGRRLTDLSDEHNEMNYALSSCFIQMYKPIARTPTTWLSKPVIK
ncbi:MAG: hypothetical protein ACI4SO_03925, partial [Muribaculaceae bacterium]